MYYDSRKRYDRADGQSFKALLAGYGADRLSLFYYGEKVSGFDVSKLRFLMIDTERSFLTDGKNIIFDGKELSGVDYGTFHVTKYMDDSFNPVSLDSKKVYIGNKASKRNKPQDYIKDEIYPMITDLL